MSTLAIETIRYGLLINDKEQFSYARNEFSGAGPKAIRLTLDSLFFDLKI